MSCIFCSAIEKVYLLANMMKHLKSVMILLGVCGVLSAQTDMKKCSKRKGLFPKPGSLCKVYYKCTNWVPVELHCPPRHHFDTIREKCEWMELFPCHEKPKRKECHRENGRFLKQGTDCRIFYDCCNGKPTEKRCPEDQVFDPATEKCEWPELYTCIENVSTQDPNSSTSITEDFDSSSANSNFSTSSSNFESSSANPNFSTSNPEDFVSSITDLKLSTSSPYFERSSTDRKLSTSSSYFESSSANPNFSTADPNFSTNSSIDLKTSPNIVSESENPLSTSEFTHSTNETMAPEDTSETAMPRELTEEPNLMCPEPFGYFPHPTDKHKFVGCVDNVPAVLTCPSDLIYNHEIRQCVYE